MAISSPNYVPEQKGDSPGKMFADAFLQAESLRAQKVQGAMQLLPALIDRFGKNAIGGTTEASKAMKDMIVSTYAEALGKNREDADKEVTGALSKLFPDVVSQSEALLSSELHGQPEQGRTPGQPPKQELPPVETPQSPQKLGGVSESTNVNTTVTEQEKATKPGVKVSYFAGPSQKVPKAIQPLNPEQKKVLGESVEVINAIHKSKGIPVGAYASNASESVEYVDKVVERLKADKNFARGKNEDITAYDKRIRSYADAALTYGDIRTGLFDPLKVETPTTETYMKEKQVSTSFGTVTPAKDINGKYFYEFSPQNQPKGKDTTASFQSVYETTFGKKPDIKQTSNFISLLTTDEQNLQRMAEAVLSSGKVKDKTAEQLIAQWKVNPNKAIQDFSNNWSKMGTIRMPNITPNTPEGATVVNAKNPKDAKEAAVTLIGLESTLTEYAKNTKQGLVENPKSPTGFSVPLTMTGEPNIQGALKLTDGLNKLNMLSDIASSNNREAKDRAWALLGGADPGQTQFTQADVKRGFQTTINNLMGVMNTTDARQNNPDSFQRLMQVAQLMQKDQQAAAELANKVEVAKIAAMAQMTGTYGDIFRANMTELFKTYGKMDAESWKKEYLKGGTFKELVDNIKTSSRLALGTEIKLDSATFKPSLGDSVLGALGWLVTLGGVPIPQETTGAVPTSGSLTGTSQPPQPVTTPKQSKEGEAFNAKLGL